MVVRIGSLELRDDLSPADWIIDRIHDFGVNVGSVIPEGFDAYARIFHPAIRIEDDEEPGGAAPRARRRARRAE